MMRALLCSLIVVSAGAAPSAQADADAPVRDAILAAVRARMGADADVAIDHLRVPAASAQGPVQARPDPGARLGRPMRFALRTATTVGPAVAWTATAEADLRVRVPHLHTRRVVSRGDTLDEADVAIVSHEVEGPLRAWPAAEAIGRSRVLRDLGPDACLAPASLAVLPLVSAGEEVRATARVGEVVAEGRLLAADRGDRGAVIRVVNPRSRRTMKARVVGAGTVEVIHD